ncbi:MAG: hypothetical protein AAF270_09360 [Pseudomonadota bacterium]
MKTPKLVLLVLTLSLFSAAGAHASQQLAASPNQPAFDSAKRALDRADADDAITMLTALRPTLRRDGDIAQYASLLCRAHHQNGDYAAAIKACSEALDTRIAHWGDYNNRGAAKLMLGDARGAIDDLRKANALRPGVSAVRRNLARAIKAEARATRVAGN